MEFRWDRDSIRHVGRHQVTAAEVVQAVTSTDSLVLRGYRRHGENRFLVIGPTGSGRILVVVLAIYGGLGYVRTAYPPNPALRREYRRRLQQ